MCPILALVDSTPKTVTINATGMFGSNDMTLPMSHADFMAAYDKWAAGAMVQAAFPNLNATQREFLMTGMTPKQQHEIFGNPDNPEQN